MNWKVVRASIRSETDDLGAGFPHATAAEERGTSLGGVDDIGQLLGVEAVADQIDEGFGTEHRRLHRVSDGQCHHRLQTSATRSCMAPAEPARYRRTSSVSGGLR